MMPIVLTLLFAVAAQSKNSDIVGRWQGWVVIDGHLRSLNKAGLSTNIITIRPDGTFGVHTENHTIVEYVATAKGVYSRLGKNLRLSGTQTFRFSDGSKQESGVDTPYTMDLVVQGDLLILEPPHVDKTYFARAGKSPRKGILRRSTR